MGEKMTESTVTPFEDFSQSLRRNVAERDEALEAIDEDYAKRLAEGAAGDLYGPYRAQRASVINMFNLDAISIGKDYTHGVPGGSRPLPDLPAPSAAYPPPRGETMPATADNRSIQQPEVRKRRVSRKAKLIGFVGAGILTLGLIFTGYSIISNNPTIDRDAVYLKLVHTETSNTSSDELLVDTAKNACKELESGSTKKDIQRAIAQLDLQQATKVELAKIVGFGIGVYCPEFS
jgi:hypothetical protein